MQSVLTLVKNTWELYRSHVSLYVGYSAWLLVPMIVNVLLTITFGSEYSEITSTIVLVLDMLMVIWVMASLIQVTYLTLSKKRIDARSISANSWRASVPLLLLGILLSTISIVGFIALIIPGIIFTVYATFSSTILVLENKNIKNSIKSSFALVQGRFWAILGRLFGSNILLFIPYAIAMLVVAGVLLLLNDGNIDTFLSSPATLMEQIMLRIIDVFFIPLFIIFGVVFYKNAKETKS